MLKDLSDKIENDFELISGEKSILSKAKNILTTQIRSVYYLQDFGCDLEFYVLDQKYNIQTQAFKNYIVDRLINAGIEIATILENDRLFESVFDINIKQAE